MVTKVLLTGSFGVGKSSIFNRFIHQEFTDKYYGTVGIRVNERELSIGDKSISIKLWDIAGEIKQNKVPTPYFLDKDIIIYTVDLNREFTFSYVNDDVAYLKKENPDVDIILVGNKKDLLLESEYAKVIENNYPVKFDWIVSAKSGENIDALFLSIAKKHLNLV
jgi:small GTP-binding protein